MGCGNREYAVAPCSAGCAHFSRSLGARILWVLYVLADGAVLPTHLRRVHSCAVAAADGAGTCVQYSMRWPQPADVWMAWQLLRKAEVDL